MLHEKRNIIGILSITVIVLVLPIVFFALNQKQDIRQRASTNQNSVLYHTFGGFSIDTPNRVFDAVSDGMQVTLDYGNQPATTSAVGQALLANHMKVVDGYISSVLTHYECHKSKVLPDPADPQKKYWKQNQCLKDYFPFYTDDNAVIASISAHLQSVQTSPYIVGYWVLDDQAIWDTPGYAITILNKTHDLIQQLTPGKSAICGFGGAMRSSTNPPPSYSWLPTLAQNFTAQGCDMVGLYDYSAAQTNTKPLPSSDTFDWTMSQLLPQQFASLQAQGWDITKEPLIGIPQAWAGPETSYGTEVTPTADNMKTQALSFCKAGAISLIWYAWDNSPPVNQFPWNTPQIAQGVKDGVATCNAYWSTSSTITPTPTKTTNQYPSFKGLIHFSAALTVSDSTNPYLAGADANFYWSQVEPAKGQYNWNVIDQAIAPWIANHKKIILRISSAGQTHWAPPYSQKGTPQWVYDLGVPFVTEIDGAIMPQYWNPIFQQNLNDFVKAFAAHYDGNPNIAYIQIGVGIGGETRVDAENNPTMLQLWQTIGYTDQLYWQAVQNIITMYTTAFHTTPLALMPDATFIGKTVGYNEPLVLDYAVAHHLWLQDNGLSAGRALGSQFFQVPHPEEQIAQTSQTGDSLQQDIQTALNLGTNYILIFSSDIDNPANQQTLQWAASLVSSGTPSPTSNISNTPTIPPDSTIFHITVCPHGLGNCGDNVSVNSGGNTKPLRLTRNITLSIVDTDNKQVTGSPLLGQATYVSSSQNFQGTISVPNLPTGQYLITIKMDGYLGKPYSGIISVTKGQINSLPAISLTTGDINNDNQLDIIDYNILISCYGSKFTTSACVNKASDLNDDGIVDAADYNLLLRELSVQKGDSSSSSSSIFYGVYTRGTDLSRVIPFEADAGKKVAIVQYFQDWISTQRFNTAFMDTIRTHGSLPLLSWTSQGNTTSPNQPLYTLQTIINGTYDAYITQFAQDAKAWGHPFFLRLDQEMNGNWFNWSEQVNGNQPGQYVTMWKHVHDIFTQVGATNVTWVWCPSSIGTLASLQEVYPGDTYVDWTCTDIYNYGGNSFSQRTNATYQNLLQITNKPIMIAELGSLEKGGSKAAWMTDTFATQLPHNFPDIKAFVWWNVDDTPATGFNWKIETSLSSQTAFSSAIESPVYATNSYANVNTSPILHP